MNWALTGAVESIKAMKTHDKPARQPGRDLGASLPTSGAKTVLSINAEGQLEEVVFIAFAQVYGFPSGVSRGRSHDSREVGRRGIRNSN